MNTCIYLPVKHMYLPVIVLEPIDKIQLMFRDKQPHSGDPIQCLSFNALTLLVWSPGL